MIITRIMIMVMVNWWHDDAIMMTVMVLMMVAMITVVAMMMATILTVMAMVLVMVIIVMTKLMVVMLALGMVTAIEMDISWWYQCLIYWRRRR